MSQIEQNFRQLILKHPEIEKCYTEDLINRRSLARYLIKKNLAKQNDLEAIVAMLRRFKFEKKLSEDKNIFKDIRINIKDDILILDFEKDKELLQKLDKVILNTDYDKGDTLKIVIGSSSIKVFIDQKNENKLKDIFHKFNLKHRFENISEISLLFPDKAINAKGILSTISREFALNDLIISELLTSTPELLIYLKEDYVLKAYELIKELKK